MPPTERDVAAADERFKVWMRLNLEQAATHFGVVTTGEPVFGWRLRSIGAAAIADEEPRWLRVVNEFPQFARGDTWTGNLDSNSITGIAKPQVLAVHEWTEHNWRRQRAELMTQLPGVPISDTSHLTHHVALRPDWWMALRQAVDTIRATPTSRINCDANTLDDRLMDTYESQLRRLNGRLSTAICTGKTCSDRHSGCWTGNCEVLARQEPTPPRCCSTASACRKSSKQSARPSPNSSKQNQDVLPSSPSAPGS